MNRHLTTEKKAYVLSQFINAEDSKIFGVTFSEETAKDWYAVGQYNVFEEVPVIE